VLALGKLGDGSDGEGEDLRASTTAEQTTLLESFNSERQRALQATNTDVEGNIIELSHHMTALEEHGRRFMANERRAMAAMDVVRETNRQNAMRIARAASVAAEAAATDAAEAEVVTTLEMTTPEQVAAHAVMEAQEADALTAVGTVTNRLRMDVARQRWRNSMSDAAAEAEARALASAWQEQEGAGRAARRVVVREREHQARRDAPTWHG
jgi:hypothetical protein